MAALIKSRLDCIAKIEQLEPRLFLSGDVPLLATNFYAPVAVESPAAITIAAGDDYGDSPATAADLGVTDGIDFSAQGIIETSGDVDFFKFTAHGIVTIRVNPLTTAPNLDIKAHLCDEYGNKWATSDPVDELGAIFSFEADGTYFLSVEGNGDNGSLGPYWISGTFGEIVRAPAPAAPDLLVYSDQGKYSDDDITCFNNSHDGANLDFKVAGIVPISDLVEGVKVMIYADGVLFDTYSPPTECGGEWVVVGGGPNCSLVPDGEHIITARQLVPGLFESPDSPGLTVTIDYYAPAIPPAPVLYPGSDSGIAGDNLTNFSAPTISVNPASDYYNVYVEWAANLSYQTGSLCTLPSLPDGTYNVYVSAVKLSGAESQPSTLTITIDTVAPAAPVLTNLSVLSRYKKTKLQLMTVEATAEPGSDVLLAVDRIVVADGVADQNGYWESSFLISNPLRKGTLLLMATDAAGNQSLEAIPGKGGKGSRH